MVLACVAYKSGGLSIAAVSTSVLSDNFCKKISDNSKALWAILITGLTAITTVGLAFGALPAMTLTGFLAGCIFSQDTQGQTSFINKIGGVAVGTIIGAAAGIVVPFVLTSAWAIWKSLAEGMTLSFGIINGQVVPILGPL